MHWRLLTMLSWHPVHHQRAAYHVTPCHSPFKHTDPDTAKRWCQDGFWWDNADSHQSSQRPWGVFSRNETYRMLLFSLFFFPLLFNLLETCVHVALLVWPLWSKNISKCSLLADNRHKNFGPLRKVMEFFVFVFLLLFFLLPNKAF